MQSVRDYQWGCVTGCSKVSPGCRFCASEREWPRLAGHAGGVYRGRTFMDVACHSERLEQPLRWVRPRLIQVCPHSDLFHESVPDEFIDQAFAVMVLAGQHHYRVITKRAARMRSYLASPVRAREVRRQISVLLSATSRAFNGCVYSGHTVDWPLPNVSVGVSVENQVAADDRIGLLLASPAAVREIVCEPLLGHIDLRFDAGVPDLVEVGCEIGSKRRPLDIDWVRSLRDQCHALKVPFRLKRLFIGGKAVENPKLDGCCWPGRDYVLSGQEETCET